MNKKVSLAILSIILIIAITLFAIGSNLLTANILGIPFGNLLAWILFIALHLIFYGLNDYYTKRRTKFDRVIRILSLFLLSVAFFWFLIAYLLSGNINFNFSGSATTYIGSSKAAILYWQLIYILGISPFVLSIVYRLYLFITRSK